MKKYLFALFLLSMVIGQATAQPIPNKVNELPFDEQLVSWGSPVDVNLGEFLASLQEQLSEQGYTFDYRAAPGTSPTIFRRACCIKGKIERDTLGSVLYEVFNGMKNRNIPIKFEVRGNTVFVHEFRPTQYASRAQVEHPSAPVDNRVEVVPGPHNIPVGPVYTGGTAVAPIVRGGDYILAKTAASLHRQGLGGVTLGSHATPAYGAYPYPHVYGAYQGTYGYGYGYYVDCTFIPGNRNCTHGGLWIDGPSGRNSEAFLRQFDIYANGDNIGPASKYNRWPNDGRRLPVGRYHIEVVRRSDSKVVFETRVNIQNTYSMRQNPGDRDQSDNNIIRFDESAVSQNPRDFVLDK